MTAGAPVASTDQPPATLAAGGDTVRALEFDTVQFEEQGYMAWPGAIDVDAMRAEIAAMLAADEREGVIRNIDGSLRPRNVFRVPAVRRFITAEALAATVRSRFTNDPILCSLGVNCVLPFCLCRKKISND